MTSMVDADYLIVGAGAAGMAFADTLLTETKATIAIIDRHHRPGGHWNDSYPFVRLHQPSAIYGVNSRSLGSGAKDAQGLNKGLYELASGQEVLSYFDQVMQQRFLPSGRVQYFPMSDYAGDGTFTSLLSGERGAVPARKTVDATYSNTTVPSTRPPLYAIAAGMTCVPLNDLPRIARPHATYVVIGAGKTAMDACLWLLENSADPDRIRWIVPRDAWLLNRGNFQPGDEFLVRFVRSFANQVEALVEAKSIDDLFARLEARDELRRIDKSINPTAYHCATVSDAELEQLRRIHDIVRLGRVSRIDVDQIVLERGVIPTNRECLHIDCSASGIPSRPSKPVFDGERITLQWVRLCQPTFSAAFIAHVEANYQDEAEKNRICDVIPAPNDAIDWLRMMAVELVNRYRWSKIADLRDWIADARLDGFSARIRSLKHDDKEAIEQLQRYGKNAGPAVAKLKLLLTN
jgi:hypothetical protein